MLRRFSAVLVLFVLVATASAAAKAPRPAATPGGLTPAGRTIDTAAYAVGDCELTGVVCKPSNTGQPSCTGFVSQTSAPSTIRVLVRTGTTTTRIDTVDFRTYVKNVLPNEWISSWDGDALKAGAVAVKSYAWYWATHYGGYVGTASSTTCFDVADDPDFQVYRANSAVARTSSAVDESWPVAVRRGGLIVQTFYRAYLNNAGEGCGAYRNGSTMSQYGTQACNEASTGYKYNVILRLYYGADVQLSTTAQLRTQHDFTFEQASTAGTFNAGHWYLADGYPTTFTYGVSGDQPMVTTDGSGFALIGVYRPSTSTFYVAGPTGATTRTLRFGAPGAIPVPAQYNGTNQVTQLGVFSPSSGMWYLAAASGTGIASSIRYGQRGDVPVPGRWLSTTADSVAVYRPSTNIWWIRGAPTVRWGEAGDVPAPADYNGDGRTDIAIWRPSTHTFWVRGSAPVTYGVSTDIPVTGDFNGDGRADLALYRPSTHVLYVRGSSAFVPPAGTPIGQAPYHD